MGQNASPEGRAELRQPGTRLIGSVAYFPEKYGAEIVAVALDILHRRPVPPAVFVKHQLVTPENVDHIYPNDELMIAPAAWPSLRSFADGSPIANPVLAQKRLRQPAVDRDHVAGRLRALVAGQPADRVGAVDRQDRPARDRPLRVELAPASSRSASVDSDSSKRDAVLLQRRR